jgi:hypothetical protein
MAPPKNGELEMGLWFVVTLGAGAVVLPAVSGLWFILSGARAVAEPSRVQGSKRVDWLMKKIVEEAGRRPGYPRNPRFWGWVALIGGIVFEVIAVRQFHEVIALFQRYGIV